MGEQRWEWNIRGFCSPILCILRRSPPSLLAPLGIGGLRREGLIDAVLIKAFAVKARWPLLLTLDLILRIRPERYRPRCEEIGDGEELACHWHRW